ncbi:hypothetical protein TBLA_0I01880 [Henningerozyma blattae CBS 6284]|uniref:Nitrogen regulatory protein areA GATA-like domain-containing protein n=1 Tax=Henningerozyma blattae (strain ATCC 34711 / CBS 6284 / DSM 70876 / NBRC 10599 / NRRL Y-10934 / UCD 77-7) TaxID=1071380 RepID=I2H8Z4_HENB6|nr:hypothetical protein TBLA_0I01880 [Tetrapisispora blattae CBS 6284]CCH62846.1 hypothetical protein TBLA_0I01880 [Tetrapisispora blattae CBS 6284]
MPLVPLSAFAFAFVFVSAFAFAFYHHCYYYKTYRHPIHHHMANNNSPHHPPGNSPRHNSHFISSNYHIPRPCDDSSLSSTVPSHVDYLSHRWQDEEELAATWWCLAAQRAALSPPLPPARAARLANACWRTWAQQRNRLNTVPPATINWAKDSDVTWLYGPALTSQGITQSDTPSATHDDTCRGTITTKTTTTRQVPRPILKARPMRQAIREASVWKLRRRRDRQISTRLRMLIRANSAQGTCTVEDSDSDVESQLDSQLDSQLEFQSDSLSHSLLHSLSNSFSNSPQPRHVRFDEEVVQCIAVSAESSVPKLARSILPLPSTSLVYSDSDSESSGFSSDFDSDSDFKDECPLGQYPGGSLTRVSPTELSTAISTALSSPTQEWDCNSFVDSNYIYTKQTDIVTPAPGYDVVDIPANIDLQTLIGSAIVAPPDIPVVVNDDPLLHSDGSRQKLRGAFLLHADSDSDY